jgi:4,5-DOPA dioxygenase extradiol
LTTEHGAGAGLIQARTAVTNVIVRVQTEPRATQNLDEFRNYVPGSPPAIRATRFGEWLAAALQERRDEELLAYRERAPDAVRNHPTEEHIVPLFVALGAATPGVPVKRLHSSYAYGVIGMDAYRFD